MTADGENSVTQWIGDLRTGNRNEASRLLWERYFTRLARVVALLKLKGDSDKEIAKSLDCGLRTAERKLEVIRKRWMAEGVP